MKKLITLVLFITAFSTSGFSQLKFGAGANLVLDGTLLGVGARAQYMINEEFSAQGQFNLLLDEFADFAIELDVYYSGFDIGDLEGFRLTPFAGLNLFNYAVGSDSGLTLGLQGITPIADGLELYLEPKIYLGGGSSFAIAGGVYF